MVSLNFQYTRDEYVKARRQYLIASGTIRKYDPLIMAGGVLLFGVLRLFEPGWSLVFLVVFLTGCALGIYVYVCAPAVRFKRTPKFHEPYALTFSPGGITFKTQSADSVLQWDIYSGLWESGEFYFLIQAPHVYALIPKRAFKDPAQEQAFEQMVLSHTKSAKRVFT